MSDEIRHTTSSGNVFADLGVDEPEESLLRAQLISKIADVIRRKHLTQAEIGGILGIDQPKVSKLVRCRISGFTSDRLLRYLTALGCDVEIEIKERKRVNGAPGRLIVRAA